MNLKQQSLAPPPQTRPPGTGAVWDSSPTASPVPRSIPSIYRAHAQMYSLRLVFSQFHETLRLRVNTLISIVFWDNNSFFFSFPLQRAPSGPPITASSEVGAHVTFARCVGGLGGGGQMNAKRGPESYEDVALGTDNVVMYVFKIFSFKRLLSL